ncbi:MAG: hypothetical protein EOO11_23370, partial [Chitinophagaceae bacterium]
MIPHKFALLCCAAALSLGTLSCDKDNDDNNNPAPTTTREWNLTLSPRNEVPAPAGRTETGTAQLKLLSDNSLQY